jgi:hypothetical protein
MTIHGGPMTFIDLIKHAFFMKKNILLFLIALGIQVVQGQSTDANLGGLSIGSGTLTPSFDPNRQSYTIIKGNLIADNNISVTPIASDVNATIEISLNGGRLIHDWIFITQYLFL